MVPKGPQTIPKHVRTKPKKCPKSIRKVSKKSPKSVRNISKIIKKKSQKYGKQSLSVEPGIEPGTLRIQLQHLPASQTIGLISSQERGSPETSYVSK